MRDYSDEIDGFFADYPDNVREIAAGLRETVRATLPEAAETLDRPGRIVGYGFGPTYSDLICTIIPSKAGVKLGIVNGATLKDPQHLLEGSGKRHKYVALTAKSDLRRPGLKALLKAAVATWKEKQPS
jgi:hypothetical protein